jgi:hypothetical protein
MHGAPVAPRSCAAAITAVVVRSSWCRATSAIDPQEAVARRNVDPKDAAIALQRDIAAALRASQPQGDIIPARGPNASTQIGYFGRFRTLGTLYWENATDSRPRPPCSRRATRRKRSACCASAGDARRARVEGRFHPRVLPPAAPDASDAEVTARSDGASPPASRRATWLEPIAYEGRRTCRCRDSVRLFKVGRFLAHGIDRRARRTRGYSRVKYLALAWALAAFVLFQDARNVRDLPRAHSALGVRAEARSPPALQTYPASALDAQTWVRHALSRLRRQRPAAAAHRHRQRAVRT